MSLRILSNSRFENEFDALPASARAELWRVLGRLRERPFSAGVGFSVTQLRQSKRSGVRVAHFMHDRYRLLYEVDGQHLILVGVGLRPGFYRRLDRLKNASQGSS